MVAVAPPPLRGASSATAEVAPARVPAVTSPDTRVTAARRAGLRGSTARTARRPRADSVPVHADSPDRADNADFTTNPP